MPKLTDTLVEILRAEREAQVLRRRYGRSAAQRFLSFGAGRTRKIRAYRRLVARALHADRRHAPDRNGVLKPALIGVLGVAVALAGASVASAAVGPAVRTGVDACLPLLSGQRVAELSATYGLKQQDGGWTVPTGGRGLVELAPPGGANPHACTLFVEHLPGEERGIFEAVDQWSASPERGLARVRDREPTPGGERLTSTWTGRSSGKDLTVVISKPLGGPSQERVLSTVVVSAR